MLAEDLKIGDIILVEGGSSNYNIEILDISSPNIKYRYTDLPKTNNWADFSTFNKTFKILEILKEGDGKRKGNKTITVSKKSKKKCIINLITNYLNIKHLGQQGWTQGLALVILIQKI